MCYFLRGAINDGINTLDYEKVLNDMNLHFLIGTDQDVNLSVRNEDGIYRITNEYCDCGTPVGCGHTNMKGLDSYIKDILRLRTVRGIKHIYICKNWTGEYNETKETVHIDDIDFPCFLANIQDNCLYKIHIYKKYY